MVLSEFSEQDATLFFKQDYHDQKMAKWQGFRLTEHITSVDKYLAHEQDQRDIQYHTPMTAAVISALLAKAWSTQKNVALQLTIKNEEGLLQTEITGKVQGFTPDNDLILSNRTIPLDDIHWCKIM